MFFCIQKAEKRKQCSLNLFNSTLHNAKPDCFVVALAITLERNLPQCRGGWGLKRSEASVGKVA